MFAQNTLGLLHYDSTSYNGLTLFSPASYNETYLIDNCGNKLNSWANLEQPGMSCYLINDAQLLRSGRLLSSGFPSPGIGGVVEIKDWQNNTLWRYTIANDSIHAHHDIHPLDNGNVLVLVWEKHSRQEAILAGRDSNLLGSELWMEALVELKPIGQDSAEIVWYWSAWDHLIQDLDSTKSNYGIVSEHPEKININYLSPGQSANDPDWLHANGIDYNEHWKQIAISIRSFSEIWIIDHSTSSSEASSSSGGLYGKGGDLLYRYGNPASYNKGGFEDQKFIYQHSVQWIPKGYPYEGKLQVFNNRSGQDSSELVIFSPPQDLLGQYQLNANGVFGPDSFDFSMRRPDIYSAITSNFQVLPNGNMMAVAGSGGKVLEFSPNGDLLWSYINPVNVNGPMVQGDSPFQNMIFRATKYRFNDPVFDHVSWQNLGPIEQNPSASNCSVSYHNLGQTTSYSIEEIIVFEHDSKIFTNSEELIELTIYNTLGQFVTKGKASKSQGLLISRLATGVYIYQGDLNGQIISGTISKAF